jgi:hypothetical protein
MNKWLLGVLAGAGVLCYVTHRNTQHAQIQDMFRALLKADRSQSNIAATDVEIEQLAVNLTAMFFRKNVNELSSNALSLQTKGYTMTATKVRDYALSLTPNS